MGAVPNEARVTLPATDAARQWPGWGTALKPAYEPIILARKPLHGTVASNVQTFGTGALNVDGCRIEGGQRPLVVSDRRAGNVVFGDGLQGSKAVGETTAGRWPANVLLDEEAAAVLDEQTGIHQGRGAYVQPRATTDAGGASWSKGNHTPFHIGDSGGASRFFYTAKASAEDRGRWQGNDHPTVKPTDLMRWLCRLVTPPGGLILDPFMGSGSTGCAAVAEGFRFVGIDLDQRHVDIAERRLAHAARQPGLFDTGAA